MTSENMCLYTLYLPLNYNDGNPVEVPKLQWAKDEIVRFLGGCTLLPVSNGFWIGEKAQIYRDCIVPILIVAPNNPDTLEFLVELIQELTKILEQEVIFIHATPVSILREEAENKKNLRYEPNGNY